MVLIGRVKKPFRHIHLKTLLCLTGLLIAIQLLAAACGHPLVFTSSEPDPKLTALPLGIPRDYEDTDLALSLAKKRNLKFERLSVEHGLSHTTVNCTLQDHYGFMWFGTEDGLNKYDGYSFTIKTKPK
jgi:hypothetical protein